MDTYINFCGFQERLTAHLRKLVRSGEVTERGLARLTQVSQPHMHHVLKGKRVLSAETADKVLRQLRLDLMDLLEPGELMERGQRERAAAQAPSLVLSGPVGGSMPGGAGRDGDAAT
ncbi:MAG: helix-turn-helix transcriptional regulator [Bryobacteraceae bacterium]